jgi:microcystin-dependent protein
MTAMPPLRDILNNTPADAINVDFNFNTLEAHVGSELINRDGSVAMTGSLSLSGPPTAPQHATSKAYVDSNVIPIATIWEYAGVNAPAGWVFCDGASKSTTDPAYVALFAAIGYSFGGAGASFNLPDKRGRVGVGRSAGDALFGNLGATGGSRDLIVPTHTHTADQHQHGGTTNTTDIAHTHDLQSHVHGVQHSHDSGLRYGYDVNSAGFSGPSNAVANAGASVAQGTPLVFTTRKTAIAVGQEDGPGHQPTYGADRTNSDGPNTNGSGGMSGNNPHSHPFATDFRTPTIQPAGVSPANGNLAPYVTVNFIIRIG